MSGLGFIPMPGGSGSSVSGVTRLGGSAAAIASIPYLNVADYYDAGSVSTDIGPAINRAIVAAAALTGPADVVIPAVNAPVLTEIVPVSNVRIIGQGWGQTVLRPAGAISAFHHIASQGSPIVNAGIFNLEIDGSAQSIGVKGVFLQWCRRFVAQHLYIHDTAATGFGCDFLVDSLVDDIIAISCGALGNSSSGGCAGVGIGTFQDGTWYGPTTYRGIVARSNKRAGLFFESQPVSAVYALQEGIKVIGVDASLNGDYGVADAGCQGLQVLGGHSHDNVTAGFGVYRGTITGPATGSGGLVTGMECFRNGQGFYIDGSAVLPGPYTFRGVKAHDNTNYGIQGFSTAAGTQSRLTVTESNCELNGKAGIAVIGSSTTIDQVEITNNRVRGNGTNGAATAQTRSGVYLGGTITNAVVRANRAYDDQGSPTQQYGFVVATGATVTGLDERDNDWRTNVTAARNIAGTVAGTIHRVRNHGDDGSEQPYPSLVNIIAQAPPDLASAAAVTIANEARGQRVVVPYSGTITALVVGPVVQSGNIDVGIYDTTATTRNRLYSSGSTACGTGGAWQVFTLSLAVTRGDQLDFAIVVDNATAQFAKLPNRQISAQLPTGAFPSPLGGANRPLWAKATAFPLPSTLTESGLSAAGGCPFIFAIISAAPS